MSVSNGVPADRSDRNLERILEIDRELDRIKDIDLLLERLLLKARLEANADAGTVYIHEKNKLVFKYTQNDTHQAKLKPGEKLIYSNFSIPISNKSISGFVAKNRMCLNIPDMYAINRRQPYHFDPSFDERTGYKTVSSLTFPLISSDGDLLGVMQLINARDSDGRFVAFRADDETFFEAFASWGSKAVQRAQMTRELLIKLARVAELRDPRETGAHVNRVASFAAELYESWTHRHGIEHEVAEKYKDILRMAAMLHDVGKVGISDIILKKKGNLKGRYEGADEYRVMQSHTWLGAQLFPEKDELNEISREIALRHHENWDGSGYPGRIGDLSDADKYIRDVKDLPEGLKGDEISLYARIVAVADVYDALSSKRVYKEAWSEEEVLKVMDEERGRKFDPELIDIFFDILPVLRNIRARYPDPVENDHAPKASPKPGPAASGKKRPAGGSKASTSRSPKPSAPSKPKPAPRSSAARKP